MGHRTPLQQGTTTAQEAQVWVVQWFKYLHLEQVHDMGFAPAL